MSKLLLSLVLLAGHFSMAQSVQMLRSPQNKGEYCGLVKSPENFLKLIQLDESRLAFTNPGGFFKIGVCWWHSRLQRSSLYLAVYQPERLRPSEAQVLGILDALYNQRSIVVIPGYANFYEFSTDNQQIIEKYLSTSQVLDSIQGEWVAGLMGASYTTPEKLQKIVEKLYQDFHKSGQIVYQMLQMPGLVAHAWLVTNIEREGSTYTITHVDSNFPLETRQYTYTVGESTMIYGGFGGYTRFVPYTQGSDRMTRAWGLAQNFCK